MTQGLPQWLDHSFEFLVLAFLVVFVVGCGYNETPVCPDVENNDDGLVQFDELLNADDFIMAADALARDFRCEEGLPKLDHVGVLVPDVEDAVDSLESDNGFKRFFVAKASLRSWIENGLSMDFTGENGYGGFKGLFVEIVSPGGPSTFYLDDLDPTGRVVQHVGFLVSDPDAWATRLESGEGSGAVYERIVEGRIELARGLITRIDFVYIDTLDETGYYIEFSKWSILFGLIETEPMPALFHLIGALQVAVRPIFGTRSLNVDAIPFL